MSKIITCFFCQNSFDKKEFASTKDGRYGKKKCCKSCHQINLKNKNPILYSDKIITIDDFCPNYPGDKVEIIASRVYPRFRLPLKGENFSFKISIYGADDDYLVKYFKYSDKDNYYNCVNYIINYAKRIPIPITRFCLHLMGFNYD